MAGNATRIAAAAAALKRKTDRLERELAESRAEAAALRASLPVVEVRGDQGGRFYCAVLADGRVAARSGSRKTREAAQEDADRMGLPAHET